ncbi:heme biosynthesis HemY N-terminal domain-containing protein [Paraferrimonas sp. SM1919]|uniref:heme biosynthesis HemY N-terminal domain-containing protein n=1 Tax=Paraferrimonas sp. SM1919 TaxID=2662263 RepID=UPI0013D40230|nr:heme biosynthesis HemY N-terminal domain-containing protein [Paraferrimonas sp. SM1919]
MIRTLVYLAIILFGMIIAPVLTQNKGYVLIALAGYQIEMSAIALFVVAIIFYSLLQLFEWALVALINALANTRKLPSKFLQKQSKEHLQKAIEAILINNNSDAIEHFAKGAKASKNPQNFYLLACKYAINENMIDKAQKWFTMAADINQDQDLLKLVEIELLIAQQQYSQAKQKLDNIPLNKNTPQQFIQVANKLAELSNDISLKQELTSLSSHHKLFKSTAINDSQIDVHLEELANKPAKDNQELNKRYGELNRKIRSNAKIQALYHAQWSKFDSNQALLSLIKLIKKSPESALLDCLKENWQWEDDQQIEQLFIKLKKSVIVLQCQVELLLKSRLYKQAKACAQQLIQLHPISQHYKLLADIQLQLGEQQGAIENYRLAVQQ